VASGTADELAKCVVFLQQDVPAGSPRKVGSGFLVAKNDEVYLVTAAHVARDVGSSWALIGLRETMGRLRQPS
jgi:S1-C subfamily serine protease